MGSHGEKPVGRNEDRDAERFDPECGIDRASDTEIHFHRAGGAFLGASVEVMDTE